MITIRVFICFFNRGWITTWQRLKHRWERLPKTHRFALIIVTIFHGNTVQWAMRG